MHGVAPPLPPNDRPPRFRLIPASWAVRGGLIAVLWALAMTALTVATARHTTPPKNRPIAALADDHVSSDTCRSCHPGNYASWHASFHRTMTQVAAPENFAAPVDGLEFGAEGTDYRIERRGRKHFALSRPTGTADFGGPQEIVLLTGSHNLQILWLATGAGRTLEQFAFAYLIPDKIWAPVRDTFLVPPGPKKLYGKGDWNVACIKCHVTQGRPRLVGPGTFDSLVGEFGISCEACHAGGREHIAANASPLRRFALRWSGRPDPTIANPARMDGPTSSLACGQCHSVMAFNSAADHATYDREGAKFRPGDKELDLRWVVQPNGTDHAQQRAGMLKRNPGYFRDIFWDDGMLRVTGRELNATMASPCYKGGHFSCLSCHEMHPAKTDAATLQTWRSTDQMKPGMESNAACLQCHQQFKTSLPAHTHHAADSTGSSCYNCHMPHTSTGLLRAIRSHQISSPNVRDSLEVGRPNACNLCHLDQPLAWTAGKLAEWYGQKIPALSPDDRQFSAGAQWLLKGDAAQRSLVVWSMGWAPAQLASGREWFYPYLIFELGDPYAAVRFRAWKSLTTLPGFTDYAFDYTMDEMKQKDEVLRAYGQWVRDVRDKRGGYRAQTILEPGGLFQQEVFNRLLHHRDNRDISLSE